MNSRTCHIGFGKSFHYFFPSCSAIRSFINGSIFPPIVETPRFSSEGPHSRIHNSGIVVFHGKVCTAGIFIDIKNFIPAFTSVCSFENPSFRVGSPFFSQSTYTGHIRIVGIYYNSLDTFGFFKSKMFPCSTGIIRTIDTPSVAHTVPRISFSCSYPKHIRVGGSKG